MKYSPIVLLTLVLFMTVCNKILGKVTSSSSGYKLSMVRRRFLGVLSSMNATVCFRAEVPYKLRTTGSQPSGRTRDLERRLSYVSTRGVQKDAHICLKLFSDPEVNV